MEIIWCDVIAVIHLHQYQPPWGPQQYFILHQAEQKHTVHTQTHALRALLVSTTDESTHWQNLQLSLVSDMEDSNQTLKATFVSFFFLSAGTSTGPELLWCSSPTHCGLQMHADIHNFYRLLRSHRGSSVRSQDVDFLSVERKPAD